MNHPTSTSTATCQVTFGKTGSPKGKIIQGDCTNIMKQFPTQSIDLVVTDPPYVVSFTDRSGRKIPNDTHTGWVKPAFAEIYRILKPNCFCISFYGWNRVDTFLSAWKSCGFVPVGHFVWEKSYASSSRFVRHCHESAYLLAKGNPPKPKHPLPDVLHWQYSGNKFHPTQKPISAIRPLIQCFSQPGNIVLDPFMGSGTTLVAARELKRRYIGIELDQGYFQNARTRLQQAT